MNTGRIREWIRGHFPKDGEGCRETRAEVEVDISRMTLGEYQDFIERVEKIRNLDNHPHTICRHVKLMREAVEIVTAYEKNRKKQCAKSTATNGLRSREGKTKKSVLRNGPKGKWISCK